MFQDFGRAVRAYGEALVLTNQLRLWKYYLIPALISVLLGGVIGWLAVSWASGVGTWLTAWYPWEWGATLVARIGTVLGGLLIGALGFILYKNLVMILAGPFMSPLSEKIEAHITGRPVGVGFTANQFMSDLVRGIRVSLRNIVRELFFTLLLLIASLIGIIAPIATILIFLIQSYYAGFGNMDYTLERYHRLQGSVDFVRRYRGLALGNGVIFMGILFTGIGFIIAPPLSTAAATIETVRKLEMEDVPI